MTRSKKKDSVITKYSSRASRSNTGTGGQVAKAFQRLVRAAWSGHADVITPKDFKTVFGRFNSKFAGYAQHDSCEALGALMDNLHEDLNRIKKKPVVEPVEDEGKRDSAFLARASWDGFKMRNDSVVVDKFFGQDKSELWCPNCMKEGKSRRKFDPRLTVLVSLPTVNTKIQEITLVRRGCGKIMKYGVTIPKKGGSGQDMAESLSKLCGIPSTSLIILEAYSHKVYKTYVLLEIFFHRIMNSRLLEIFSHLMTPSYHEKIT